MKRILFAVLATVGLYAGVNMLDDDYDALNGVVAFTYGDLNASNIIIVSDPSCPACQRLVKDKDNKLSKYRVSVVLFPIPSHKNSKQQIAYILNGKGNVERKHRYKEMMIGNDISYKEFKFNEQDLEKYIQKVRLFMNKHNVTGTPTILEMDISETSYYEL